MKSNITKSQMTQVLRTDLGWTVAFTAATPVVWSILRSCTTMSCYSPFPLSLVKKIMRYEKITMFQATFSSRSSRISVQCSHVRVILFCIRPHSQDRQDSCLSCEWRMQNNVTRTRGEWTIMREEREENVIRIIDFFDSNLNYLYIRDRGNGGLLVTND